MIRRFSFSFGVGCVALAQAAGAQQPLPPVRPLGPIVHVTTEPMRAVSAVRELPGRRVLVNDILAHRVLLFDSTLATYTVVADSTASTANAYGNMPGGLIPYRGDSSLFIDPASLSMLVLNDAGKIAKVLSVPRPNDAIYMIGGPFGTSGFDPAGRLVYRGATNMFQKAPAPGADPKSLVPELPDSAPIVRVTLATRAEDTVAFYRIAAPKLTVKRTDDGNVSMRSIIDPMPVVDDWALLPDGTVAIVRGRDFHVDWVAPDGSRTSSPKIAFNWQRMTDEQKAAYIDSAKTVMEKRRADLAASRSAMVSSTTTSADGERRTTMVVGGGGGGGGGGAMMGGGVFVARIGDGGGDGGAAPPTRGGSNQKIEMPPLEFVAPYELPDYRPAFTAGAMRADADGNLWIRTTEAEAGRPVYDVVDRQGALVDRVQLPAFRTIAGFGPGVVYMGVSDSTGVVHLERARIR